LLGLSRTELSVVFVNSERMRRLNARYRGIDRPTDVLSFPLSEGLPACRNLDPTVGTPPLGDIVICVPKALAQSRQFGVTFRQELLRLLIHGLLHLAGYDHEINAYRKRKMKTKEKELFDALQTMA
jgi:probable rRNA maturation factor